MPGKATYEDLLQKKRELEEQLVKAHFQEHALRQSGRQMAEIINFLPDAMFAIDLNGRVTAWNQAMEVLSGVKAEEILGKGDYEYALPFYGIRRPVLIDMALNWNEKTEKEYVYVRRKGNVLVSETRNPPFRDAPSHFWNSARPLHDEAGNAVGAIEVIRDITEIKQTHQKVEERERLLQTYIANTPAPTAMFDLDMRYIACSRQWYIDYQLPKEDLIGLRLYDTFPDLPEHWKEEHQRVLSGEAISVEAELLKFSDGHLEWVKRKLVPWRNSEGKIGGIIIFNELITQRKQMEADLSAEKERLSVTLRSIGDAVITTDRSGRITLMNPIAEALTGWSEFEARGLPLMEVFNIINENTRQPCSNPAENVLRGGQIVSLANHTLLIDRGGREYVIADSGAPILDRQGRINGVVLVFRDTTAQQRTEKELLKMEKLKSLGVLAGGIAHDFNNFLTGIVGNLSLARLQIKPEDPVFRVLGEMEKAALRAKTLTQQLLTFSKGGKPVKQATSIIDLVHESAHFALRGSNVRCEFNIDTELQPGDIDEAQIAQVIQNLIINADQAMPEGGIITIQGSNVSLSADNPYLLAPGDYIMLTLGDQGVGIRPDHLKKVFDPYFTTKQKGSGLGLAVAYNIITKHGGQLTVDSKLGQGTTFALMLPAAGISDLSAPKISTGLVTGRGRILVMDDEDFIQEVASTMLKTLGYEVALAADGRTALTLYQQAQKAGNAFDAVILDLTVPGGLGGKQTLRKLRKLDPKVKAIVSSGYSNDPVMASYASYGFSGVVKKPYQIEEMSQVLHAVVSGD